MKSLHYPKPNVQAGDINLRGKKSRLMSCRCCEARDLREKEERQHLTRTIRRDVVEYYLDKED